MAHYNHISTNSNNSEDPLIVPEHSKNKINNINNGNQITGYESSYDVNSSLSHQFHDSNNYTNNYHPLMRENITPFPTTSSTSSSRPSNHITHPVLPPPPPPSRVMHSDNSTNLNINNTRNFQDPNITSSLNPLYNAISTSLPPSTANTTTDNSILFKVSVPSPPPPPPRFHLMSSNNPTNNNPTNNHHPSTNSIDMPTIILEEPRLPHSIYSNTKIPPPPPPHKNHHATTNIPAVTTTKIRTNSTNSTTNTNTTITRKSSMVANLFESIKTLQQSTSSFLKPTSQTNRDSQDIQKKIIIRDDAINMILANRVSIAGNESDSDSDGSDSVFSDTF